MKATGALTGTIYGTISSSSFSTNTTVDVVWDSGSLQNEVITVYLGILSATNQSIPLQYNGGITGEMRFFGGPSAPSGWLLCDGSAVLRTTYAVLFAVLGTTWGAGDGSTTFNLPNLKGRVPVGLDAGQSEFNALGETGGAKTHTLITAELPSHTHGAGTLGGSALSAGAHTHDFSSSLGATAVTSPPAGNTHLGDASGGTPRVGIIESDGAHTHTVDVNSGATAAAGSGAAHNNLQPYGVGNWIIKT